MAKKKDKKSKSTEAKEVKAPKVAKAPETPELVEVTLLGNAYVSGKLYLEGDTVKVRPEHKARLVKKSPTLFK